MTRIYDIAPSKLINMASEELKKIEDMKMPVWAYSVKTVVAKERPPEDINWWYKRAASLMRKLYVHNLIGVNRLRSKYSSRKNNGHKPEHTYIAGGKIIRVILQQLEKAEFVQKKEIKKRKGRSLTKKGKSFLDNVVKNVK